MSTSWMRKTNFLDIRRNVSELREITAHDCAGKQSEMLEIPDVDVGDGGLDANGFAELTVEGGQLGAPDTGQLAAFQEKVHQAAIACSQANFDTAVRLYTAALQIDPRNHVLYSNRSAAHIKMGSFHAALADAVRARELSSTWPKAYYREGVALQHLGRHSEALAAFASGLSQDPKSEQMLDGLIEAALSSPLKNSFEPLYRQLQAMRMDRQAFVITSVIGQELLDAQEYAPGAIVLEAALLVGSAASLKLRGSVLSALSSAYWALNDVDKAISYMQQDLTVAKALNDVAGECRAHHNLGSAFFSKGFLNEALQSHKNQLVLAMRVKDTVSAAQALTSLGHVYTALGDLGMALASHQQCVQLIRENGDRLEEARETGNIGAVYLAMGDFDNAVRCHFTHVAIAKSIGNRTEEAKAYSNLGSAHHFRRQYTHATEFYEEVLRLAIEIEDRSLEARAYAGLGHAARAMQDSVNARRWYEKQLDLALASKDRVAEARSLSNLGTAFHMAGEYGAALKLHQQHLRLARSLGDVSAMIKALGNIGKALVGQRCHKQAIKYHNEELRLVQELGDRSLESSTHGHLAVVYQALGMHEQALSHHHAQLNIARELNDAPGEACALCNLGNCYSSKGEFARAIPYYENFLRLSQELGLTGNETRACHFLGYAHFCLGNHSEAITHYERALCLSSEDSIDSTTPNSSPDTTVTTVDSGSEHRPGSSKSFKLLSEKQDLSRAYCNLGLARAAVGDYKLALECQRRFLTIAQATRDFQGEFRALGNIGDAFMRMGNGQEAIKAYQQQLILCREDPKHKQLEASSYSSLGNCHREMKIFDKALGFHAQELQIHKELGNLQGECRAQASLGQTHTILGNFAEALRCFQAQLEKAREVRNSSLEVQALTNVGVTRLRLGHFDEALATFQRQAALLDSMEGPNISLEQARIAGYLGECNLGLGEFKEAIECFQQYLRASIRLNSPKDQEQAYRGVGNAYKSLGDLPQAVMYFEKRLVVAHEIGDPEVKCGAYGDLGALHGEMANYTQAISCLEHKMRLAQDSGDLISKAQAAGSLGKVYAKMQEFDKAIECHRMDLQISEESTQDLHGQARAHGNLGDTFELMREFEEAIRHQEVHLRLASQLKDKAAKALAFSSLGRIYHARGDLAKATEYLQQGLSMAELLGKQDEEAQIRRRLAFALWAQGDLHGACIELGKTADLVEASRYLPHSEADQRATYAALQRAQVLMNRHESALTTAERLRVRFDRHSQRTSPNHTFPCSQLTTELIVDTVDRQKAAVIYFSVVMGSLYSWLIVPQKGVVKFAETTIVEANGLHAGMDIPDSEGRISSAPKDDIILKHLNSVKEALGIGTDGGSGRSDEDGTESDSEGFGQLRRNHLLNSSSYSLSSVFSVGSVSVASANINKNDTINRNRSPRPQWTGPPALHALYNILIAPFEDELACVQEIAIVPDGTLHLVPFAMLRGETTSYLGERFSISMVPSISALKGGQRAKIVRHGNNSNINGANNNNNNNGGSDLNSALVIGNPRLTPGMQKMLDLGDIPRAHEEAELVGELLMTKPLLGLEATKESVMCRLEKASIIHIAAHISWKLPGIVLSLGSNVLEGEHPYIAAENAEDDDEEEIPVCSEFLLSPQDLKNLHLRAKLVVLSSCHTRSEHGEIREEGLTQISKAFLAAGAQCVILSLWPVTDTAVKILYRTFYSSLLQGSKAAAALAEAMRTIQTTKQFAHPANWSSFVLIGVDVRVAYQAAAMGQALVEMLREPEKSRDALRVCLHLVEKSLQRIHRGQRNAMYTTQKSIENKIGCSVSGWKELLISMGFRFEPAANNLPAAVFFPQADPGDRLNRCSANLQALLGLSAQTQGAIAKVMSNGELVDDIVHLMRRVVSQLSETRLEESVECPVSVKLWSVPGCHELLASLGFDLMEVGRDEVTLRLDRAANPRTIEFALQALLALLDPLDPQDEIRSVQDEPENSDDDGSLESHASLRAEPSADFQPTPHSLARRSRIISVGDGAFSHFVKTRGEPDGLSATAGCIDVDDLAENSRRPKSSKSNWSLKEEHIYASASSHGSMQDETLRSRIDTLSLHENLAEQRRTRNVPERIFSHNNNNHSNNNRSDANIGLAPSFLNILRSDLRHVHGSVAPATLPCPGSEPPRINRPPPPPPPSERPRGRAPMRSLKRSSAEKGSLKELNRSPDSEEDRTISCFTRSASEVRRRSGIFSASVFGRSKDSLV